MPRTISDDEWNYFQGQDTKAKFIESIYNDPALTNDAKALIKRKYPNLKIDDYDLRQEINARFEAEKKEREEREERERREKEDAEIQAQRDKTQKKYGLTDEAMQRLEQLMKDRFIGDYEAGALLLVSREPKTSEPTFDSHYWHHDKQDGFAEIAKDPEGWGRGEIMRAIRADEERARNGR